MALNCTMPVKSSGRQSMLSEDPVTDNSHLRYFCKVVLQRCRSVCNIDDSEPRCWQRAHLILAFKLPYVRRHHYTPATRTSISAISFLPLLKQSMRVPF
ncbi:hypothetical protein PVAP13_1NG509619 [Panicum virgatum]|uniref:Uncharacterized protein n=1 Tax=Panicum virgatum TaxID=38727 RepID=A0A8T0X9Q4_PANVG|nr:hypothetical protein PVAP13_1NG509619 [Panicum virgatum]